VLIAGGSDKRLDFAPLAKRLCAADGLRGVVLLPGSGTDRLQPLLAECRVDVADSMAEAVDQALDLARPGDAVLLSPACASFGLFSNEFDRGDQYVARLRERGLQPMSGSNRT